MSVTKFITSNYNYNDMSYDDDDPSSVPNLDIPKIPFEVHCYINPPFCSNPAGQSPSLKGHLPPISFKEFVLPVAHVLFEKREAENPKNDASNTAPPPTRSSEASPKKRKRGESQDTDTDLSSTHSSEAPPKKRIYKQKVSSSHWGVCPQCKTESLLRRQRRTTPICGACYEQNRREKGVSKSHWGVCPQCKTESLLCRQLRITPICQECDRRPFFRKCDGPCGEAKWRKQMYGHPEDYQGKKKGRTTPTRKVCRMCWAILIKEKRRLKDQSAMASNNTSE